MRGTSSTATRHTCNDGNPPIFGRRTHGCARCEELAAGAAPRTGWGARKRDAEARHIAEIRAHSCAVSRCGPMCTFGDW